MFGIPYKFGTPRTYTTVYPSLIYVFNLLTREINLQSLISRIGSSTLSLPVTPSFFWSSHTIDFRFTSFLVHQSHSRSGQDPIPVSFCLSW